MKKKTYLLACLVIFLDQLIKLLVSNFIKLYDSIKIINNFFYITYVKNDGAAFSILRGKTYLLLIIAFLVLSFIIWYINKQEKLSNIEVLSYGLIIGGIIGNFIDRLIYGQVIDYLDFKIFTYDYPVFNLADSCIVIGIIIMCYLVIRSDISDSRRKRNEYKN